MCVPIAESATTTAYTTFFHFKYNAIVLNKKRSTRHKRNYTGPNNAIVLLNPRYLDAAPAKPWSNN